MKIEGVDLGRDEVLSFQDAFLGSVSAGLIGKVLDSILAEASVSLENCGSSEVTMRQAQGVLRAVRRFDEITKRVSEINVEMWDEMGDEYVREEGIENARTYDF